MTNRALMVYKVDTSSNKQETVSPYKAMTQRCQKISLAPLPNKNHKLSRRARSV